MQKCKKKSAGSTYEMHELTEGTCPLATNNILQLYIYVHIMTGMADF